MLQAGASYSGGFSLPVKSGTQFITIQSSALASLPPAGSRVKPSDAANMPKLAANGTGPVVLAENSAHHFRFIGIEFKTPAGGNSTDLVLLGFSVEVTNPSQCPHDIELDRVYIHGEPTLPNKRGVALNGIELTVKNSYYLRLSRSGAGQSGDRRMEWTWTVPYHQ